MSSAEVRFYVLIAVIVATALTVLHAGLIGIVIEEAGRCV